MSGIPEDLLKTSTDPAKVAASQTAPAPASGKTDAPAAADPVKELAEFKAKFAETQAELDKLKKAAEESSLSDRQKREKHDAEVAKRLEDAERRSWVMDLREAGIPKELASLLAVPEPEKRAAALEAALKSYQASLEIAKRDAAPAQGSKPINPLTMPGQPQKTPEQGVASRYDDITAAMVKKSRQLR